MTFQGKIYDGCVPDRDANQECDWCSTKAGKFLWSIYIVYFNARYLI